MSKQENIPIFAAIDLGTNNCRLMVAKPSASIKRHDNHIKVIDTFSRIVRLGDNLAVDNKLTKDAMQRTLVALKHCKKKLEKYQIEAFRFVTTEACRLAKNSYEFLDFVYKETGLDIEIITNEQEAKFAFMGCASLLLPQSENAVIFDIGGGSTEFLWVKRDEMAPPELLCDHLIVDWLSLDKGVMNLSEIFGGSSFAEMYYDELVSHVINLLKNFDRKNKISEAIKNNKVQILSTSGTLTTLAAVHLGLSHYERSRVDGLEFLVDDLQNVCRKIIAMRPSERFANGCIGPERSEYIIAGCAMFEAITSLWNIDKITIADRGVREGLIISLMQQYNRKKMLNY